MLKCTIFICLYLCTYAAIYGEQIDDDIDDAHRTGQYTTSWKETHPLGLSEPFWKRVSRFKTKAGEEHYDLSKESFTVVVPDDYNKNTPYGLFVFINSIDTAYMPYTKELKKRHMIGVCVAKGGNDRSTWLRMHFALDAVYNIQKRYNIDERRVVISGISGGGFVSSRLAIGFADIFTGALYLMGCESYTMNQSFSKEQQARIKFENRYVFVTGGSDFNKPVTMRVHSAYTSSGFKNATYIEYPHLGHGKPQKSADVSKMFDSLDQALIDHAQRYYTLGKKAMDKEKMGEALFYMRKAYVPGCTDPIIIAALASLDALEAAYRDCLTDIQNAQDASDFKNAKKILRAAKKTWKGIINSEYRNIKKRLKAAKKATKKK